jgi:hypothetical protein
MKIFGEIMDLNAYHDALHTGRNVKRSETDRAGATQADRDCSTLDWIADTTLRTRTGAFKQPLRLESWTRTVRKDGFMKILFKRLFHPTNRSVRVLVGLLLVCLLAIQVTQSVATSDSSRPAIRTAPDDPGEESELVRLARTDHVTLLENCLAEFDARPRGKYTCTFTKQERIRGQLGQPQRIAVKFMEKPFSIAMTWQTHPPMGDALIFVEGKRKDADGRSQMLVRPTNPLFQRLTGGSVQKLPDGPDAMRNTLRPCTAFGFRKSLNSLLEVYRTAGEHNECVEKFIGYADVDGRECVVIERVLPNKPDLYPAWKTRLFIDTELLLPVRVIGWDWNDKLVCDYRFTNITFDPELDESDFTPQANDIKVKGQ